MGGFVEFKYLSCGFIGWLAKIKISNTAELDDLLDEKAYEAHCASGADH
jgi:glycine cleavage system H lipoate-binding protein